MEPIQRPGRWRLVAFFYELEVVLSLIFVQPWLALWRGRTYLQMLLCRVGLSRRPPGRPGALWIHAPTVGELQVTAPLVRKLPMEVPLVVTIYYEHGWSLKLAQEMFAGRAVVTYPPLLLSFAMRRFVDRYDPSAFLLVESQAYPLIGLQLIASRMPVAIVNANVAWRTREVLTHRLVHPLLPAVELYGVRSEDDARQFVELGVPSERIVVTGNFKFELPELAPQDELKAAFLELAGGRPILIAGSVHTLQEGENVLRAFERIGGERALLLLAPRLVSDMGKFEALVSRHGLPALRRSSLPKATGRPAVVLLDTLGELAALYEIADAAFLGGTLGARGGHNPMEAARFGVPLAVGPNMDHFLSIAELFDAAGAWCRVSSTEELAAAWKSWLDDPEAGRRLGRRGTKVVEENQGALEKTFTMIQPLLRRVMSRTGSRVVPSQNMEIHPDVEIPAHR